MTNYWNDGTSLYHYGIPGQRWGERRFQNLDGSLTEEGRRRYGILGVAAGGALLGGAIARRFNRGSNSSSARRTVSAKAKRQQIIRGVKTGAKLAAIGVAAIGVYSIAKDLKDTKELNDKIKLGRGLLERELAKAGAAVDRGDILPNKSVTVNYTGNDNQQHQARINYHNTAGQVTGYSYYNMNANTQNRAQSNTEKAIRNAFKTTTDKLKNSKTIQNASTQVKQKASLELAKQAIKSGLVSQESVDMMLKSLNNSSSGSGNRNTTDMNSMKVTDYGRRRRR